MVKLWSIFKINSLFMYRRNIDMKKTLIAAFALMMAITLAACSTKPKDTAVDFDVKKVGEEWMDAHWPGGMAFPMEDEMFQNMYEELDLDKLNEYVGYTGTILDANRIFIFEVKDEKDVEEFKKLAETMREDVIRSFENYLPAPKVVAEASEVIVRGRYVLFVSLEDKEAVIEKFNQQFEAKK